MSCYLFIDIIIKKKLAKLENISAQGPLKKKHATQIRPHLFLSVQYSARGLKRGSMIIWHFSVCF